MYARIAWSTRPGEVAPEGDLPQRGEIPGPEKLLHGLRGLLRHVHLALAQALHQLVRGHVDELHLVGHLHDPIGHGLAYRHAGDLRDDVIQALDMLDVERRLVDVDPRRQNLRDVLVPLRVPRARRICVRQLIDDREFGGRGEHGVQVELLELDAAVLHPPARQNLEPLQQDLGLRPAVGLDVGQHHPAAVRQLDARRLEHRIGLTDAGRVPEKHLQLPAAAAALLGLRLLQQSLRAGPLRLEDPRHGYPARGGTRSSGRLLRSTGHTQTVPDAGFGQDVLGPGGVGLDFVPELADVDTQQVRVRVVAGSPHLLHQVPVDQDFSGVQGQRPQQRSTRWR